MKATGIVRRIDDLGRVVIPKEVRQQLGIREGDPLELYMSDDGKELVLKDIDMSALKRKRLQRVVNAELRVLDLVNGTHPALSKKADYPRRANLLPRLEFHLVKLYHTALQNGKRGI